MRRTLLEKCFQDSCDAVATDVASAIAAVNLACDLGIKHCRALVHTAAKLATAAVEGFRNVAAGLDSIASLCASAMATTVDSIEASFAAALEEGRRARQLHLNFQAVNHRRWLAELDVDADAGGLDFKQCVDVPSLDGCQFVCAVDKDKDLTWPRGQRAFTVRVDVMTPYSALVAALHPPPDAVTVGIHGDDTATWTCAQRPDGCGIVVAYTAGLQAAEVELTVHVYVLGTAVFTHRLVMECICMFLRTW